MSLPIARIATAVPTPQVLGTYMFLVDYFLSSSLPAYIVADDIIAGASTFASQFNQNAAYLDILAQYGGGVIGLVHGLLISAGSGLTLNVSAGGALIGGAIQKKTTTAITLPDNTTSYIWLKQNGTFAVTSTTTPPTTPSLYIGSAITLTGAITTLDGSGILYYRGLLYRETNDPGVPGDTPPGVIILTKTLGGLYLWTGSSYVFLKTIYDIVEVVTAASRTDSLTNVGMITTNTGAGALVNLTLPAPVAGMRRTFYVDNVNGIKVIASTGKTIQVGTSTSSSGGNASNTVIGSSLTLVALDSNHWVALSYQGTWTVV